MRTCWTWAQPVQRVSRRVTFWVFMLAERVGVSARRSSTFSSLFWKADLCPC